MRRSVPKALALAVVVLLPVAACGGSSEGPAAPADPTTTTSGESTTAADDATTTAGADEPTTTATATTSLPDASLGQHSAPGDGTGTALLTAVRVGRNEGFERIVFEFEGDPMPGYRVQWVDGPITSDGSGDPVDVAGEAHLEIVLQPASGVDLESTELRVTYDGPDRIATGGKVDLIEDLVRTGDFEAVLTWVAGTSGEVPFRVLALRSPTRIAIDLAT
ncbi:MAG: hypothetical protein R2702_18450 [Acidimicrobiales bacterium]